MSGDAFSFAVEKESESFIKNIRRRTNIRITPEDWCGFNKKNYKCEVLLDNNRFDLCKICKYKRKFDIPKILLRERRKNDK